MKIDLARVLAAVSFAVVILLIVTTALVAGYLFGLMAGR
jgi:hypothetical protein